MNCLLCYSNRLKKLGNIGIRRISVTSDSKLSPLYSKIYCCKDCGHMQKIFDKQTRKAVDYLYDNYDPHYLSRGNEQLLFPKGLPPRPRTYHAIEKCIPFLPKKGLLIDIGTGNGAVLRSSSKLLPGWELSAFDINNVYKDEIYKIKNFDNFYSNGLAKIPEAKFDLIVLWHVLEHLDDPLKDLSILKGKLNGRGYMLVQVPDISRNPFDLAVMDHRSHFTANRLVKLFDSLGFTIIADGNDWVHNCLTYLLKKGHLPKGKPCLDVKYPLPTIYFDWLNNAISKFERVIKRRDYAIFGTGMSSILLAGQLSRKPIFFIDEDKHKAGSSINQIPIVVPASLKNNNLNILMPFEYGIGMNLMKRMREKYASYVSGKFILTQPFAEFNNEYSR